MVNRFGMNKVQVDDGRVWYEPTQEGLNMFESHYGTSR